MKRLYSFGLLILVGLFLIGLKNVAADCTDTDGGIDPFVFGTATANNGGFITSASDSCITSGFYVGQLNETYCKTFAGGYSYVFGDLIKCGNGYTCSDGACIEIVSGGGGSPVYKKVKQSSPALEGDGPFWTLFFMQLAVIALLFYVISKKLKK